jgi:hypothetical protein
MTYFSIETIKLEFANMSKFALVFAAVSLFSLSAYAQTAPVNPVHEACHADVDRVCPDHTPGTEGAKKCIKENYEKMSDGCKAALAKAQAAAPAAPAK